MSGESPLDLGITELDGQAIAAVDQLRKTAQEALGVADRFLATWEDGEGGVVYAGFAGDAGGDAIAFFGYTAARALHTFQRILDTDTETATKAVVHLVEEMFGS